jgi:hypothetical protein
MFGFRLLGVLTIAFAACATQASAESQGPWCARSWGGSDYYENCAMRSLAMCLAEIRGVGGNMLCSPNPSWNLGERRKSNTAATNDYR